MTVRVYASTDPGAPTLGNVAGSLVNLLSACLVTGYGAQAPAGWSLAFSGTNQAVYRSALGARYYLHVNDTGTTSANVRAYEVATGLGTGQNPCPPAIVTTALWNKANAAARPWYVVASERTVFFACDYTGTTNHLIHSFGDFKSKFRLDRHNVMLTYGAVVNDVNGLSDAIANTLAAAQNYAGRSYTQVGLAAGVARRPRCYSIQTSLGGAGAQDRILYPNPPDNALVLAPVDIYEYHQGLQGAIWRGIFTGIWHPRFHGFSAFGSNVQQIVGSGPFTGKTFLTLPTPIPGLTLLEISNTWDE